MLAILYLISNLDRTNIGNAAIEGLSADLGLTGVQYNIALSILFITYVGFGKLSTYDFLSNISNIPVLTVPKRSQATSS